MAARALCFLVRVLPIGGRVDELGGVYGDSTSDGPLTLVTDEGGDVGFSESFISIFSGRFFSVSVFHT